MDLVDFFHKKYYPDLSAEQVAAALGNPEVAEAAYNYVSQKYYPNIPPKKIKERVPIIVNNPNDPRLKAYNDSLSLYNVGTYLDKKTKNYYEEGSDQSVIDSRKETIFESFDSFEQEMKKTNPILVKDNAFKNTNNNILPIGGKKVEYTVPVLEPLVDNNGNRKKDSFGRYVLGNVPKKKTTYIPTYQEPIQPYVYEKPIPSTTNAIQLVDIAPKAEPQQLVETLPAYTSQKQTYQGREFMETTGLRPGLYHPEEVELAKQAQLKKNKRAF